MAAGFTIQEKNIENFTKIFEDTCSSFLNKNDLIPSLLIDIELNMVDINVRLIDFLKHLEPYGPYNPKPKFLSKKIYVDGDPKIIGKDQSTIKFFIKQKNTIYEAIGFRMIEEYEKLIKGNPLDIVYNISENNWKGKTSLQLEIIAIRYSDEN